MKALPRQDVGTTPRKKLTPRQRLALFERRKGICCICGNKIVGDFIDEHWRALGLGGSNDQTNRDIAHKPCAEIKTKGDMAKTESKVSDTGKRIDKLPLPPANRGGLFGRYFDADGKPRK